MPRVYIRNILRSTMCKKSSILSARSGVWKISSVASGFNSITVDDSDYLKSLISKIAIFYLHLSRLLCCNYTCYCVNMFFVMSASRDITSASRYQPSYQRRSSMYICGLIPRNFAELAEAVQIECIQELLGAFF